ncbi:hypothetical protein BH20ACT3_BH20ACT3_02560 [soil metagenome]
MVDTVSSALVATGDLAGAVAATALAVAERFAAGAVLWCISPEHPEHARHLAVEFVHPVIMGKPALPAVSVDGPDVVATMRSMVRSGDVVVAVGGPGAAVVDVVRRCPAWGAMSVWIGTGDRVTDCEPDHLLWIDDPSGVAAHDGQLVLVYHLLWELTHVCLEHGVTALREPEVDGDRCITCSDEARMAEIISTSSDGLAEVRIDGERAHVDVSLIDHAGPDDLVLVHAGTAIAAVRVGNE